MEAEQKGWCFHPHACDESNSSLGAPLKFQAWTRLMPTNRRVVKGGAKSLLRSPFWADCQKHSKWQHINSNPPATRAVRKRCSSVNHQSSIHAPTSASCADTNMWEDHRARFPSSSCILRCIVGILNTSTMKHWLDRQSYSCPRTSQQNHMQVPVNSRQRWQCDNILITLIELLSKRVGGEARGLARTNG